MTRAGSEARAGTAVLAALLVGAVVFPAAWAPVPAALVWLLCLRSLSRAHPAGALSLGTLYLVLLGLFHLGVVVPVSLGVGVRSPPGWTRSPFLPEALGYFTAAVLAFTLGARHRGRGAARAQQVPAAQPHLFLAGAAVAAMGAALLWIGVWKLGLLQASYAEYFERAMRTDVRFFGFGMMLFPIGVVIGACGANRRQLWGLGVLLALTLGPLFFRGFRGPVLVQATALLAVWARKDLRSARRLALGGLVLVMVAAPAIRATRNQGEDPATGERGFQPLALVSETGGSLYPLIVTVEARAAAAEPLWLGRSYLMSIQRIVPNVSARWRGPTSRTLTPSVWATRRVNPWAYENGGGIGFSGVAEPYLNFGGLGLVAVFFVLGGLVRRWDGWLGSHPFRGAAGAATFGFVLWTVRNDGMELFRAATISMLVAGGAWLLNQLQRRHHPGGALRDPRLSPAAT
ncbi:MAG: O-antigen polysaccharide polymerase Wzy [Anaeromyxobacter sp.]